MPNNNPTLDRWHAFINTGDPALLDGLLADDIAFYSPVFWTPKHGKPTTTLILATAAEIFEDFAYEHTWIEDGHWALAFRARIGETHLKGVDQIHFDATGRMATFEVCIRPLNALQRLGAEMGQRLAAKGFLPG